MAQRYIQNEVKERILEFLEEHKGNRYTAGEIHLKLASDKNPGIDTIRNYATELCVKKKINSQKKKTKIYFYSPSMEDCIRTFKENIKKVDFDNTMKTETLMKELGIRMSENSDDLTFKKSFSKALNELKYKYRECDITYNIKE